VRLAENERNTQDPEKVAIGYTKITGPVSGFQTVSLPDFQNGADMLIGEPQKATKEVQGNPREP
jgi:hypothetical protein